MHFPEGIHWFKRVFVEQEIVPAVLSFAYNYHMTKLNGNRIREGLDVLGIVREDLANAAKVEVFF